MKRMDLDEMAGCSLVIGGLMLSACVGVLTAEVYGWLTLAIGMILCAIVFK